MVPHLLDRIDGCDGSPGLGVAVIGWEGQVDITKYHSTYIISGSISGNLMHTYQV